ncbi:MAG: metallophosphoesterase [Chloroflexi bacterium]|nr:metallophosphoesterase [Chloroflexota bacterium]
MKILHTADIHLREYGDERWKALQNLIEIGKQEEVEIFAISGDLFDKGIDAEILRPKIREIFSGTSFEIILLPGNHDSESYKGGMYFGKGVRILTNLNEPHEYGEVRIWGLPFEPIGGEEILGKLRLLASNLAADKTNILLYHGELLDAFFSRKDFGDEGEGRYMPVKLSYFKGLNISYVLAGHFHSRFDMWKLEDRGYFVYPGSPISITKREIGQRKVNIFKVGDAPKEYMLNTPHFEEVVVEFDPFSDENPVDVVKQHVQGVRPEASIILTIKGYVNSERTGMREEELVEKIRETTRGRCAKEPSFEFRDIRAILEDGLFKSFMSKLERSDYPEEKRKHLRDLAIRAMMKARA